MYGIALLRVNILDALGSNAFLSFTVLQRFPIWGMRDFQMSSNIFQITNNTAWGYASAIRLGTAKMSFNLNMGSNKNIPCVKCDEGLKGTTKFQCKEEQNVWNVLSNVFSGQNLSHGIGS